MKTYLLPSLKLTAVLIILCAVLYPLLIAGIAKTAPGGGNGLTITSNGKIVGYENIGQLFNSDGYFQGRPSAVNYNAAGSAGSNKGASNPEYLRTVQERIDTFLLHNPTISRSQIPSELVTASGSGLDPNISVKAARIQVSRIAKARHRSKQDILQLIDQLTEKKIAGFLGMEKVNVLKLNIELDTKQ